MPKNKTEFDIPELLIKEIADGNCAVFVGAGLSMGGGLPGWEELIASLRETLGCQQGTDPLIVAQVYQAKYGRRALVEHIISKTDTTKRKPTDCHLRLALLPIQTWITTNYDDFIERTLKLVGKPFRKVVIGKDLPYVKADEIPVIKLHGDREHQDTIAITQQDCYTRFENRMFALLKDHLSSLLAMKTLLFVGYSVSDPDFHQVCARILLHTEEHARRHYAVTFNADDFNKHYLLSMNLEAINIPAAKDQELSVLLDQFLRELMKRVSSKTGSTPVKEYDSADATSIVPKEILRDFSEENIELTGAIEWLAQAFTEYGQHYLVEPEWEPLGVVFASIKGQIVKRYKQQDSSGNTWAGAAFGVRRCRKKSED